MHHTISTWAQKHRSKEAYIHRSIEAQKLGTGITEIQILNRRMLGSTQAQKHNFVCSCCLFRPESIMTSSYIHHNNTILMVQKLKVMPKLQMFQCDIFHGCVGNRHFSKWMWRSCYFVSKSGVASVDSKNCELQLSTLVDESTSLWLEPVLIHVSLNEFDALWLTMVMVFF